MKTIIKHILYGLVVLPALIILTEMLDVAAFPAIGAVLLVSISTSFANAFTKAMKDGEFS